MTETSWEVEQIHWSWVHSQKTKQKPQSVCPSEAAASATLSWRRSGKAIWVSCSLDTPLCIFYHLTWRKISNLYCSVVSLSQLWAFRGFPFVIWCVSKSCYRFGHHEPHLFDTFHLFVGCLYVIHLSFFLPVSLVVGSFSSQSLLRNPTTELLRRSASAVQTISSLTASITLVQSEKHHPTDNAQEAKAVFQLDIFVPVLIP